MLSLTASREHDVDALLCPVPQAWNVLRRILEVAIHDNGPGALTFLEARGDGGVLTEVPAETERADARVVLGELSDRRPRAIAASVVDEDDFGRGCQPIQRRSQTPMQLGHAAGGVVNGNDDADLDGHP